MKPKTRKRGYREQETVARAWKAFCEKRGIPIGPWKKRRMK